MNQLQRTQKGVSRVASEITDLLDLAGVEDESPTSRKAARLLEELSSLVSEIPQRGRTAFRCYEEGRPIHPVKDLDVRKWMNIPEMGSRLASLPNRLLASPALISSRVLTQSEFKRLVGR